ncbi:MAG: NB-ARC domain-containing protein [Rubrivivax sp.]
MQGLEEGPQGLRCTAAADLAAFDDAFCAGRWAQAAALGEGRLLQGLDEGPGDDAWAAWLQQQRAEHHQRWHAAVRRAVEDVDAPQALAWARALLRADAADGEAMALLWRAAGALQRHDEAEAAWAAYVQQLREQCDAAPPSALRQLVEGPPGTPVAATPLLGRDEALERLQQLLGSQRLVTLLGPGGVGKSRLALQAAVQLAPRFAEGAVWVPLEDLGTPAAVAPRIAERLGLRLAARDSPPAALARALAGRSLLLVLDGFEAVIDAADGVAALLSATRALRVLVTSRERLDLAGEHLLPLAALPVPDAGAPAQAVLASPAAQLFLARAQALQPGMDGAAQPDALAAICRRTEGLPLALELAAAWVRVLPRAALADELAAGLQLLDGDGPQGRGLQALFQRSWQLLTLTERDAFTRLAVFRGGFTREAALAVAGVPLPTLAALVDKSMLRAAADGRFDQHALLAEFARGLATRGDDAASGAERHSRWYLARLGQGADDDERLRESGNILAAWRHAVQQRDADAVDLALQHWPRLYVVQGRLQEAADLCEAAAAAFGDSATAAHLQAHRAWLLLWLERYAQARELAGQALQRLERSDHVAGAVMALRVLGHAARREARHADSAACFERALQRALEAALEPQVAMLRDALAMALNMLGRHDEARVQLQRALSSNRARGDDSQLMYNQFNLSQSHSLAGDAVAALPWAQAALATQQRVGYRFFEPYARTELGAALGALGRHDEAMEQLRAALRSAADTADRAARAGALEALARCRLRQSDPAAARRALAEAAALCLDSGNLTTALALVPTAVRAWDVQGAERGRWLSLVLAAAQVQQAVRRECLALLDGESPPLATEPGLEPWLRHLAGRAT